MPADDATCRLLLVLETDAHGAGLECLEAVLAAGGPAIACVLLKPRPGGKLEHGELGSAIRRIQARDVAVLLQSDPELARELGDDGVHLPFTDDEAEARSRYAAARAALGSDRTVGASAGLSKHMAMVYGEIGADYVAFEGAGAAELAQWWVPLFEVPVVAMGIEAAPDADRLAASGVDFVGVELAAGPAEALAQHVGQLAEAISIGEAAS
jgi:thiamine-phosphate pyrophosphorylase